MLLSWLQPSQLDVFTANIAKGSGADLPAILGSQSIQQKDAVIIMRKGKEMMVFPGPGSAKMDRNQSLKYQSHHPGEVEYFQVANLIPIIIEIKIKISDTIT